MNNDGLDFFTYHVYAVIVGICHKNFLQYIIEMHTQSLTKQMQAFLCEQFFMIYFELFRSALAVFSVLQ